MVRNSRIIRWLNQNRYQVFIAVFVFILAIIVVHALNNYAKEKNKNNSSSENLFTTTTYNNSSYTITSGESISKETNKKVATIINNFIEYCNKGETKNAYDLLSEDCKKELFPTIEQFNNNYCNLIFKEPKEYTMQSWITTNGKLTYLINLKTDLLATGRAENTLNIQDYFTIVNENGKNKLNINNYIGEEAINKQNSNNDLQVTVISKKVYMDYEIYKIQITNKSQNTIKMDSRESEKSTYLIDKNEVKYISFNHELIDQDFIVNSNITKELNIKFNKEYNPELIINRMVFSDVILDYEQYNKTNIKKAYNNRTNIEIEL